MSGSGLSGDAAASLLVVDHSSDAWSSRACCFLPARGGGPGHLGAGRWRLPVSSVARRGIPRHPGTRADLQTARVGRGRHWPHVRNAAGRGHRGYQTNWLSRGETRCARWHPKIFVECIGVRAVSFELLESGVPLLATLGLARPAAAGRPAAAPWTATADAATSRLTLPGTCRRKALSPVAARSARPVKYWGVGALPDQHSRSRRWA